MRNPGEVISEAVSILSEMLEVGPAFDRRTHTFGCGCCHRHYVTCEACGRESEVDVIGGDDVKHNEGCPYERASEFLKERRNSE